MMSKRELLKSALGVAAFGALTLSGFAPARAQAPAPAPANAPANAQGNAAPRRLIVVVAEGLSGPLVDFASPYARTTADPENPQTAFDLLKTQGQSRTAPQDALTQMRGLLKTAQQNGYRTGLVTTGDAVSVAGLFYDVAAGTEAQAVSTGQIPFDVLGGGGRAGLTEAQRTGLRNANTTALLDADTFQATEQEARGRVLALQADQSLSYEVDRDPTAEAGLADLASYAQERLGQNNAPFVLVIHDTLLAQALAAKDTVALLNQFRTLDGIAGQVLSDREENPNLSMVMLGTGSASLPRFASARPEDQSNAFFIVSNLNASFSGAGRQLTGVNEERLQTFIDETYPGFAPSAANRQALLGGTLTGEQAVRQSYEPVLGINYETTASEPTFITVGVTGDEPLAAAKTFVSTPSR